jgi:hypothetical protein
MVASRRMLELSQEAVSLLAWSIEQLGDPFAIAGFHSDTRHDVRYLHIKGYSESWGDAVKAASQRCRPAIRRAWARPCATPHTTSRHRGPRRGCCWSSPTANRPTSTRRTSVC